MCKGALFKTQIIEKIKESGRTNRGIMDHG